MIGILVLIGVSIAAELPAEQIGKVTVAYHVITLLLYTVHERAWDKTTWGRR